jgi:hypothetical protein
LLPLTIFAPPALAQEAPSPAAPKEPSETTQAHGADIVVVATPFFGQLKTPQKPVITLDEEDIEAYGANSISDLVDAISPETSSGRGRGDGHPIILLNGQRISSFRELRSIPTEAIRRLEVLPEEVSLRFGYPPNQRVINFILEDNFISKTITVQHETPTRGGFGENELEATLVRINGPRRLNITGKFDNTTMLTEAERGVRQAPEDLPSVASDPEPARYRSLIDASRDLSLDGTWSTGLGEGGKAGSLAVNAAVTRSNSRSLFGLDSVLLTAPDGDTARRTLSGPLTTRTRSTTLEGGLTLNKPISGWRLTATLDASHADTVTQVDRKADTSPLVAAAAAGTLPIDGPLPALASAGSDRAHTRDDALTSLVTFAGTPFRLPAGDASLTVKAGFSYTASHNSDTRTSSSKSLKRGDLSGGVNIALPLTSRRNDVLGGVGDISLDLSAGLDRLSDFGVLTDWSAGLTWSPTDTLTLGATYIVNEAAPTLAQLGNPQLLALNVPVYDFTRGEAAVVTIINGGNPGLKREKQRDLKLSANWKLPIFNRSSLIVEYFHNHSSDVSEDFPLLTPAIEAAFPGRAIRDASGRLVAIDRRPVTFSDTSSSSIRWGVNLSGRIGKGRQGGRSGRDGAHGGDSHHGGGGAGFMRRGDGRGRWNFSLYHTMRFSDRVTIAPGGPQLNLLNGDALVAGGVARHAIEMEGGAFYKGLGFRLNGDWMAPVHVRSSGAPGASDLRFGSTFVLNARLFVNLGQQQGLMEAAPFLKGSRLSLRIDNILDSRQKVTDASGAVPLAYQPDYRDPRGRVIGVEFRKMF